MTDRLGTPIVLVVGRPAAGKTTLSRRIAERFELPLLAKDDFKEILFDSLGTGDREWSRRVGRAAFALLDHAIPGHLAARRPFVVDAPFDARLEDPRFRAWQDEFAFTAIQVHCVAEPEVLAQRFAARAASGSRHIGHADAGGVEEFRMSLRDGRAELLTLRGRVLTFDSTRPGATEELLTALEPALRAGG